MIPTKSLLILALIAVSGVGSPVNAQAPDLRLVQADSLYEARSTAESLTLLEQIDAERPGDYEVLWRAARAAFGLGVLEEIDHGSGLRHSFAFEGFGFEEMTQVAIDVVQQGPVVFVAVHHDCTGAPRTREIITSVGWPKSLARLKSFLERGESMPWPEGSAGQGG